MGNKEYEMKMLKEGFSPEVIRNKLKESGYYIKKSEPEKIDKGLSQELKDFFDSVLRDFKNVFQ